MDMRAWIPIENDPARRAEARTTFTIASRRDSTPDGRVWSDCSAGEAWDKLDEYGADGSLSLSADWDRVHIHNGGYATLYELSRPPVFVLTLSAWITEKGVVIEEPEKTAAAWWSEAVGRDIDPLVNRAANWLTCVPDADPTKRHTRGPRASEAREIIFRRLRRWAYDQLETVGVPLRWVVEDHRIRWEDGAYRTLVKLSGTDHEAVREEWIGGLPRKRRELLAADRFRRVLSERTGKPVDMNGIKAGTSGPEAMRDTMGTRTAPQPSEAMFRLSSWVDWTCPDTGVVRRGVVIEERLSRSLPVGITVLPDDGGEPVDVAVSGRKGKLVARLESCGRIKKGEPGTVTVADVPSLDEVEWNPEPAPEPEPNPAAAYLESVRAGEPVDLFALFMSGPADTPATI
jgi:hypothetical protein